MGLTLLLIIGLIGAIEIAAGVGLYAQQMAVNAAWRRIAAQRRVYNAVMPRGLSDRPPLVSTAKLWSPLVAK